MTTYSVLVLLCVLFWICLFCGWWLPAGLTFAGIGGFMAYHIKLTELEEDDA